MTLDRNALLLAFRVNHHPDAEPSSVELGALSRSITAYLAALPEPVPAEVDDGSLSAFEHRQILGAIKAAGFMLDPVADGGGAWHYVLRRTLAEGEG